MFLFGLVSRESWNCHLVWVIILVAMVVVPGSYLLSRVVAVVLVGWYCIGVTGKGWMWWWWWWWWLQQQCSGGDSWMEMFFCSIGAGASGG